MKKSAGIIPYKIISNKIYVYLEHPGGPYHKNKDTWSICKGEKTKEKAIDCAIREFKEESGFLLDKTKLKYLTTHKLNKKKLLICFTIHTDLDVNKMKSNTFDKIINGKKETFYEMDQAKWFYIEDAYNKIFKNQKYILYKLKQYLEEKWKK